ncbi:MAG TPA: FAD-binding oxidoreductase [Rhizomicrobium sp.]|nr:FAD-binding oxidoreductase [Rhizomicrobium sp.]
MSDAIARLKQAVGPQGFTEDAREIAPRLEEWRGRYHGRAALMLKPKTTAEISAILAICNGTGTPIVPQGGNTGLVGGQIPFHGEVLLSLARMNAIRGVDADAGAMICEAGVILADAQAAARRHQRCFPLSLAPEGSCTIGGNLSTNAGGVNVLRYGNARELALGLEVVLADGTVLDMLRTLRKDNTGYDLKQLFIGAEGTLGVIAAAALKLFPLPATRETAFVALPDPAAAIALLAALQEATGGAVSAFELIPRIGLEMVLAHIPQTADPLAKPSPWYALAEAAGGAATPLRPALEAALARAIDRGGAADATLAASEAQRAALWRLREAMSEAQKPEGGSIKHDVSLPIRAIPEFLARGAALVETIVPGARPVPFGHLGDGNIHFNVSVPRGGGNAAFLAKWETMSRAVHDLVHSLGGSISAEHGIGIMKRNELPRYKSAAELALMRTLKRTLDPKNILNPGKVLTA